MRGKALAASASCTEARDSLVAGMEKTTRSLASEMVLCLTVNQT
jgi:hypothetical protein